MPSLRIPLVGSLTNRNVGAQVTDTTDQQFTNAFPEVTQNEATGKQELVLNKRPGFAATSAVQAGATGTYGSIVWTTTSSSAKKPALSFNKSGGTSTMIFDTSSAQIGGDVPGTFQCWYLSETSISNVGNLTGAFGDSTTGNIEHWFYPEGGAWTQVSSGNFPSSVAVTHAHMDGYMFVMNKSTGEIQHSDLNTLATWSAASKIRMNSGGTGIGLLRHKNFILGFSEYATEFFYNAGNAGGSVLGRVPNGVVRIGIVDNGANPPPIKSVDDSVYMIGSNAENGSRGVYRISANFQVEKISNAAIDRLVGAAEIRYVLGSFPMNGKTHVAFGNPTNTTICACYCIEMKTWWYFVVGGALSPRGIIGWSNSGLATTAMTVGDNGRVYTTQISSPVWQDDGSAYSLTAQTNVDDYGTYKKKYFRSIAAMADSQATTSALSVSYSDDDDTTFASAGSIDLSTVPPPKLIRLGASRRRAWKLTHSANTPCRVKAVYIDYDVGIS